METADTTSNEKGVNVTTYGQDYPPQFQENSFTHEPSSAVAQQPVVMQTYTPGPQSFQTLSYNPQQQNSNVS